VAVRKPDMVIAGVLAAGLQKVGISPAGSASVVPAGPSKFARLFHSGAAWQFIEPDRPAPCPPLCAPLIAVARLREPLASAIIDEARLLLPNRPEMRLFFSISQRDWQYCGCPTYRRC
jgi:hypothetical protein